MVGKIQLDYEKLLSYLVDADVIPKDVIPSIEFELNDSNLIEAINTGSDLYYDDKTDELYYIDSNNEKINEKIVAPDISSGASIKG